jgi:dihydrodipicolinate synthase/N-acetylneuraminate lyase
MHSLCALALEGNAPDAKALNDQLMALHDQMFVESNPIPVKYALWRMNLMADGLRLPLTKLNPCLHSKVDEALSQAGLI